MKTLWTVKKIPGELTVVPLLLGVIVNTFFGNVSWSASDGTPATYLRRSGAMPILAVFISYDATTVNFKKAGVTVHRDMPITTVKVGVGIIIGLICGTPFGEKGFLGLSALAIVGALASSNGGLHAAPAGRYGGATDVGIASILSTNGGPFFTMVALRAAGVAKIPMPTLIGRIVPVIVGCILGNLGEDIRKFCELGAAMLIPFFTFPLGAELNIMSLLKAGDPEILLDVACTLIISLTSYLAYKLLRMDYPEVGGTVGATAGNTVAMPASVAVINATLLAMTEAVTTQVTTAITVIAILCPVLVLYSHKIEVRERGGQRNNRCYHG